MTRKLTTKEEIIQELKEELAKDYTTLDEIKDNSGEWIDNYVPIYNNHIIEEWQEMPSDYDNVGASIYGIPNEISIINLMQLDLNAYYSDLFNEAVEELESELEEANA